MSLLSRQCGILNITQPNRPPRPVTGIALHVQYRLAAETQSYDYIFFLRNRKRKYACFSLKAVVPRHVRQNVKRITGVFYKVKNKCSCILGAGVQVYAFCDLMILRTHLFTILYCRFSSNVVSDLGACLSLIKSG
jgi:hypothetical protein